MSGKTEYKNENSRKASTTHLVREDYHRQPILTLAEVALIVAVNVSTVVDWVLRGRGKWKGRKKLPTVRKVGPLRVARTDLDKFLSL